MVPIIPDGQLVDESNMSARHCQFELHRKLAIHQGRVSQSLHLQKVYLKRLAAVPRTGGAFERPMEIVERFIRRFLEPDRRYPTEMGPAQPK